MSTFATQASFRHHASKLNDYDEVKFSNFLIKKPFCEWSRFDFNLLKEQL